MKNALTTRLHEETGQDLIEYVVLAGGIGIALFAAFALAPLDFQAMIDKVNACIRMDGTCA